MSVVGLLFTWVYNTILLLLQGYAYQDDNKQINRPGLFECSIVMLYNITVVDLYDIYNDIAKYKY